MEDTITTTAEITSVLLDELAISINNLWVLMAAILVMFMQPGFAMLEAGFTRKKNTANIMMKNLMDFSIGALIYWIIGYSVMYGETLWGFIGKPDLMFFNSDGIGDYADKTDILFQTVFAATAATIVSGAMAERTKFHAYFIFSFFITLFIYPVSGHWLWGGGWLDEMGFMDFAGSTIVHSLGAWVGLAGAIVIGPRLGKYVNGGKPNAIPGHNLAYGALGVFILWFGWFGFNAGSQLGAAGGENTVAIGHIALTTNLSAAAGAVAAMLTAYARYKRPSLSLSLNGALAGLVAITAGADAVSPGSAIIIGLIAGIILVFSVEFFDQKLKVDDPVGAISVHGICGAFGTLMVGIFAIDGGLLYGGGFGQLGVQAIGVVAIFGWAFIMGLILFKALKASGHLRVSKRIEEEGLDIYEHGESVYN